jgi:hypothetical protein
VVGPIAPKVPIASLFEYFPDALLEVARVSYWGSKQHHPDKPVHWDRSKSGDHVNSLLRHFLERGKYDADNMRHSAKLAWRSLAMLQLELEADEMKEKNNGKDGKDGD